MLLSIMKKSFLFLSLLSISIFSSAQQTIQGKVTNAATGEPLYSVVVLNKKSGNSTYTDTLGLYQITLNKGDSLTFHHFGFHTKKYKITPSQNHITQNVALVPKTNRLHTLEVQGKTKYEIDSLKRIQTFRHYLNLAPPQFIDKNAHYDGGFGLVFHPFTYFSKEAKRKRRFKKMFQQHEKQAYINSRYTRQLVHKTTDLQGDSLTKFMNKFRPSYRFTRKAKDLEFQSWILKHYKKWIR